MDGLHDLLLQVQDECQALGRRISAQKLSYKDRVIDQLNYRLFIERLNN